MCCWVLIGDACRQGGDAFSPPGLDASANNLAVDYGLVGAAAC